MLKDTTVLRKTKQNVKKQEWGQGGQWGAVAMMWVPMRGGGETC